MAHFKTSGRNKLAKVAAKEQRAVKKTEAKKETKGATKE